MVKHLQKSTTDVYKESSMSTKKGGARIIAEARHTGSGPCIKEAQFVLSTDQKPIYPLAFHWKITVGTLYTWEEGLVRGLKNPGWSSLW